MWALLSFKARCFGDHLLGAGYWLGCPRWASKPSLLGEMLQVLSSLLIVGHHARDWVYSEIVSQPHLPALIEVLFVCLVYESLS